MDLDKFNNISYHDGYVSDYHRLGNNISFILKDGWSDDSYYKFEFKNIKIEVMNNRKEIVSYILDVFNNMNNVRVWLYSGEIGKLGNKLYLKLWIRFPDDIINLYTGKSNGLCFDGLDVELCDDYDDTGCLYIKFIADEINITDPYPLLKKYSRTSKENLNNLFRLKTILGKDEFKFFSAVSLRDYLCTGVEYNNNDIVINYKNMFRSYDKFILKFINILCDDDLSFEEIVEIFKELSVSGVDTDCIRLIDYKNNEFIFGILLSNEHEIILNCKNIVYDGCVLSVNSFI